MNTALLGKVCPLIKTRQYHEHGVVRKGLSFDLNKAVP